MWKRAYWVVFLWCAYTWAGCGERPRFCRSDVECFSEAWRCINSQCVQVSGQEGGGGKETGGDGAPSDEALCQTGERRSCYDGAAGTQGVGLCSAGEQLCIKGVWGSCVGQISPIMEVCNNGFDDDCDGKVDEDCGSCKPNESRDCYNGPSGTRSKGLCKDGKQVCRADKTWGNCVGEVLPSEERCDGEDNDCNGLIDDKCFACRAGEQRQCFPSNLTGCEKIGSTAFQCKGICKIGTQGCEDNGQWGACVGFTQGRREVCNGLDDNCDGQIDEGLLGELCPRQDGVCAGATQRCGGTVGWLSCDEETYRKHSPDYYSGREIGCDGKDNNCDGLVDEGCTACQAGQTQSCYSGATSTQGKGICKSGTRTCQADRTWGACVGEVLPQTEICNGLDDDCDGKVDEESFMIGRFCDTARPGICAQGVMRCAAAKESCESLESPKAEICNGLDDDCDGKIDEGAGNNLYYRDADGDGFGDPKNSIRACRAPAGYVLNDQDCYDGNKDVFPGQMGFFTVHRGDGSFDYNCDNQQSQRYTQTGSCKGCTTPIFDQGFVGGIPACGQNGNWIDSCRFDVGQCFPNTVPKLQECR